MIGRLFALAALVGAFVFAAAGVALMHSHDPARACAPFLLAALMGWCSFECWLNPGAGTESAEPAAQGGQAPARVD